MSSGPKLTFDSTLGAASVGFFASAVVFGVLTSQAFTYFRRYPSDKLAYKALVAAIWLLELLDQIFIGYSVYFYVVTNYSNPLPLIVGKIVWPLITQVGIGASISCIVKTCFALRVWRFSHRNIFVTGALVQLIIIFVSFGFGIAYAFKCSQLTSLLYTESIKAFASSALATGVAADVLTAASLCFFLRRLRTGHRNSDSLVNTLTIYAVNTGALTSLVSTITVILYNIFPNAFYFMGVYFVLSQLYALSFFCTLNTRKITGGRGTDREMIDTDKSLFAVSHHRRTENSTQSYSRGIEIGVARNVTVESDIV